VTTTKKHGVEIWMRGMLITSIVILFVVTSWLSEDAYITFRTVDNFVNGYGLTWNVAERVQSYTHPLWMLIVAGLYAVTGEIFFTVIALSILLSSAAVAILLFRVARTPQNAVVAASIMLFSKAFIDFSTGGLENPLVHLLLALFLMIYLQPDVRRENLTVLALIAGCIILARQDMCLILLPSIALLAFHHPVRVTIRSGLIAGIPVVVWHVFSLFYYGAAIPNTAYAKLNVGIDALPLFKQGLAYVHNSLVNDPVTLVAITAAVVGAILSRERRPLALASGVVLYLIYTVKIGGDCMSGRFLAAPLLLAAALVGIQTLPGRRAWTVASVAVVIIGLASPHPTILSRVDDPPNPQDPRGINDVRSEFYPTAGLLPVLLEGRTEPFHEWADDGRALRRYGPTTGVRRPIGFFGFYAGPDAHIIDQYALTEPLLARLPTSDVEDFYVGHFPRMLPIGYFETVVDGRNQMADAALAEYYDKLRFVIRGDLFDLARVKEIWNLNTGVYDGLQGFDTYRLINRGLFFADRNRLAEALQALETAARMDPTRAVTWYHLSRVAYDCKRTDLALRSIEEAVRLAPEETIFRNELVKLSAR